MQHVYSQKSSSPWFVFFKFTNFQGPLGTLQVILITTPEWHQRVSNMTKKKGSTIFCLLSLGFWFGDYHLSHSRKVKSTTTLPPPIPQWKIIKKITTNTLWKDKLDLIFQSLYPRIYSKWVWGGGTDRAKLEGTDCIKTWQAWFHLVPQENCNIVSVCPVASRQVGWVTDNWDSGSTAAGFIWQPKSRRWSQLVVFLQKKLTW